MARVAGSVNERKREAMESDLFDGRCGALGYQPDSVLSIRVNPGEVVLVHQGSCKVVNVLVGVCVEPPVRLR
jgi:hypothetical protein